MCDFVVALSCDCAVADGTIAGGRNYNIALCDLVAASSCNCAVADGTIAGGRNYKIALRRDKSFSNLAAHALHSRPSWRPHPHTRRFLQAV